MREDNPPVITEDYGAVVVYDYIDRKEGIVKDLRNGAIAIPRNIRVDSVVIERTFKLDTLSTFVFPFDADVKQIEGLTIYTITAITPVIDMYRNLVLEPVTGKLHAYEPYVVKATATTAIVKGPVTLKKTVRHDKQIDDSFRLIATLEYIKFTGTEYAYGIAASGEHAGRLVSAGKGSWIGPLKAYILKTSE